MNGLYELTYAESVAADRARLVERRANEAVLLAGLTAERPVRARLGRGLIRLGMRLAPQVEPTPRPRTSPN